MSGKRGSLTMERPLELLGHLVSRVSQTPHRFPSWHKLHVMQQEKHVVVTLSPAKPETGTNFESEPTDRMGRDVEVINREYECPRRLIPGRFP